MPDAVLSILAHPDDAEFLCAGALVRLKQEHGWDVHIATMTPGDCGSAELPPAEISRIRRDEGKQAAARIQATYHCLEERDLLVTYNEATLGKIVALMRAVRPAIVLTHSPADYMLDHEMTSMLVRGAAFAAPIPNFLRDQNLGKPLPHIPHLYYCDPIEGKGPARPGRGAGVLHRRQRCDRDKGGDAGGARQPRLALEASRHGSVPASDARLGPHRGQPRGVAFAEGFRQHQGAQLSPGQSARRTAGVAR